MAQRCKIGRCLTLASILLAGCHIEHVTFGIAGEGAGSVTFEHEWPKAFAAPGAWQISCL